MCDIVIFRLRKIENFTRHWQDSFYSDRQGQIYSDADRIGNLTALKNAFEQRIEGENRKKVF